MPIAGIGGTEFPRIGTIRKGDSKESGKPLNKRDLGPLFRVVFNGTDERTIEAQERFVARYGSLQPDEIDAVFTVDLPEEGNTWRYWLEAYDKGALVLQTDGEWIQYRRDRKSGLAVVRNGRRVETGNRVPYDGAPAYSYYSKKNKIDVPVYPTAHGYLRILVPALRRLAYLELRTTSFWDCDNIDKNLHAIAHTHGSLKGIPCIVRRRLTPVSKPLPGGKRFWDDEWLVFVEAAPEWVDDKLAQLEAGSYSATYQLANGTEQDDESTVEPVEAEVIDAAPPAEAEVAKPEAEGLPEDFNPTHCVNFTEMAQAAVELLGYNHPAHVINTLKKITNGDSDGLSYADMWQMLTDHQAARENGRPFSPADLRRELHEKADRYAGDDDPATDPQARYVARKFTEAFAPAKDAADRYHLSLSWLWSTNMETIDSATKLTFVQAKAVLDWLLDKGGPDDSRDTPLHEAVPAEAAGVYKAALIEQGQADMFDAIEEGQAELHNEQTALLEGP